MRLDVFYKVSVNLFDGVVQDVILKAGSNSFIGCLLLVVVVLDDFSCSDGVGCDVRLDLLIESCRCHCLWLVFLVSTRFKKLIVTLRL